MGINTDFAPDADVNVNPLNPVIGTRSFSSDPALVASMVAAQVNGYQRTPGSSPRAKHFPGHGDTATDSHTGIPVITHTREQWERIDAPPFQAAISAGIDMIMTAHLVVPALDPSGDPATLSKPILTGILRERARLQGRHHHRLPGHAGRAGHVRRRRGRRPRRCWPGVDQPADGARTWTPPTTAVLAAVQQRPDQPADGSTRASRASC